MTTKTTDRKKWYQSKVLKIALFVIGNLLAAFSHFFLLRADYYMIWEPLILLPFGLLLSLAGASHRWILLLPVPVLTLSVGMVAFEHDFSQPILLVLLGLLGGTVVMYFCLLFSSNTWFRILSVCTFSILAIVFVTRWTINYRISMDNVFDLARYAPQGIKNDSVYAFQYYRIDGRDSFKLKMSDKKIILDFWTLSCATCIEDLPHIYDLIEQNPYPEEFEIYSVLLPYSKRDSLSDDDIRDVLKKSNANFIFTADVDAREKIGIHAVPQFILLDSSGKVLETGVASTYEPYDGNLRNVMKRWKDL